MAPPVGLVAGRQPFAGSWHRAESDTHAITGAITAAASRVRRRKITNVTAGGLRPVFKQALMHPVITGGSHWSDAFSYHLCT